jgi:hypothetical protein
VQCQRSPSPVCTLFTATPRLVPQPTKAARQHQTQKK